MTREEFLNYSKDRFIFLDGATGSNLQKKGMKAGDCPEEWILSHREALIELQRDYVEAGTNIVYAPTFTGNRIKLKEYGLDDRIEEINTALVSLSKEAVDGKALVAGDLTMTGVQLKPTGPMDFEELVDIYKEQIIILEKAGVDLLVVETMMSLNETRAALIAAKEVSNLAVICTLTFESDGRTLFGTDAITAAVVLESLGAAAVGANCSTGPDKMVKIIRDMSSNISIPVIAKPNAGMPKLDENGDTVYDLVPDDFARDAMLLVNAGASILGGCCGTTPMHIMALVDESSKVNPVFHIKPKGIRYLTSERKTHAFSLNDPFMVVGERINPTGKKKLQAELREGSLEIVRQYTEEQEEKGAVILDVNVGMGGIDEKETMLKVLDEVTMQTSLPISIDTSPTEVLEAALRKYPGRALVNSISCESAVMLPKLEVAKKYGAMIILLPLSDTGIPATFEEKLENLNLLLSKAYEYGFTKEDIVVDGLVSTVGANPNAAKEVIETVKYCYENGLATTCGLSNISFGLPERSFVNSAFLTMLIQSGLTMAIMNPSQELLMNAVFASDLLMNKENASIRYIERMNENSFSLVNSSDAIKNQANNSQKDSGSGSNNKEVDLKADDVLYNDVLKGNIDGIVSHTQNALDNGQLPEDILNNSLMSAIDEVGIRFNNGKYFLPQLIASAEAMKKSIELLEPLLAKTAATDNSPVVIMATVKGDIHDIGKNLVTMMMKNHGFKVIDLGKDVDREIIIDEAIKNNASIIGLSALMTTTMKEMKNVIMLAKEKNIKAKIMVGGAVITPEYADEIGADGYSKDAAEAVVVAKQLLGI